MLYTSQRFQDIKFDLTQNVNIKMCKQLKKDISKASQKYQKVVSKCLDLKEDQKLSQTTKDGNINYLDQKKCFKLVNQQIWENYRKSLIFMELHFLKDKWEEF